MVLLSALMKTRQEWTGTPTELTALIDPDGTEGITAKTVSRRVLQSVDALRDLGILAVTRRSNGKRLIELHRADGADAARAGGTVPVDPGRTDSRF